jgi:hypothetical protein
MLQTRCSSKLIGESSYSSLAHKNGTGAILAGECRHHGAHRFSLRYIGPYPEQGPVLIKGSGLGYRGGIPRLAYPQETTSFAIVKQIQLTRPELAFIIVTRAMIGAGIALLLADRFSAEQRKAVGSTLALVGLVTTIPAVWAIFGKCE